MHDTNLTASANSMTYLEAAVNSDLENLRKWLIANKLSLNVAKTEFILIGSKSMIKTISNSHPNVFIENKQIKQVYECKTLRVKIDQHLSWKGNTDEICKKLTAGISAIRRIRPFVDQDTLILVYNAIVRPYFDYCSEVWDVFGEAQSKGLQKLQKRAARIILNVSNDVEHNIALGWLSAAVDEVSVYKLSFSTTTNLQRVKTARACGARVCILMLLCFFSNISHVRVVVRANNDSCKRLKKVHLWLRP